MQKNENCDAKLRLQVSDAGNRTFIVKSAAGRAIGHAVGGHEDGPGLLVAGAGDDADLVFQRVLGLPGIGAMRGRLVLLNMDRLNHPGDLVELDRLAACVRPITDTLFLSAVTLEDAAEGAAPTEGLFQAILGFCARHGMELSDERPADPIIRDYAS